MSARVNDRPHLAFPLVSAAHLPLTGESHPLRREFEKWLAAGHLVTLLVASVVFMTWYLWPRAVEEVVVERRVVDFRDFYPPPSIDPRARTQMPRHGGVVPEHAVPEPVDEPVDPNATIPGRDELPDWDGPPDGGWAPIDSIVVPERTAPTDEVYVWFDRTPELIRIDPPVYPGILREAGIDGTVLVRALVGVNGRVKEAVAVEGSPALYAPAIESVRSAVFRPALQGTCPVEVWVAIPVVFQLHR
jgi:TonB family protein